MRTAAGGQADGIARWAWQDPPARVTQALAEIRAMYEGTQDPGARREIGDAGTMLARLADSLAPAGGQIEMTGDGHGHHIPGSPIVYRHGWKPVTASPAEQLAAQIGALPSSERYFYEETGRQPPRWLKQASAPIVPPRAPEGSELEEQRRLLSMWTRSFRYAGTTQGTPRDAEFTSELHRMLTDSSPPGRCGPGCQDAHEFLEMVDQKAAPVQVPVARGISLPEDRVTELFPPGGTVDLPIASWTKKPEVAVSYAESHPPRPGKVHAVIHMPPGGMGMELTPLEKGGGSWLGIQAQQDEVLTGGRFRVQQVTRQGMAVHIHLGPQEDFRAQ